MPESNAAGTRREFLGATGMIAFAAELAHGQAPTNQAPTATAPASGEAPVWETGLVRIAEGVYAYQQGGGPGKSNEGISNAGVIIGPKGILIIDSLGAPLHAKNLIRAIRQVEPAKPFVKAVITHFHPDHILGLPFFPEMEILAHEFCRRAMLALPTSAYWARTYPKPIWDKKEGWADGGEPLRVVSPTITISDRMSLYIGDTEIQLISMAPGHTYGDVAVYLPAHKILFAGDIAFHWVAPFLNSGHATSWITYVEKLLAMDVETIVPGHGPIGTKRELAAMRDYLLMLKGEARLRFNSGMSPGRASADIKLGRFATLIGAEQRMPMNVVRLYAEFSNTLTPIFDMDAVQRATEEYNSLKSRG